jgi:phosphoribosylanthranilate isomerase
MIFHPKARRCVSVERAREILRALPAFVTPVALFVDQDVDEVRHTAASLGVRHVQLHGDESPADVAALGEFAVVKALKTSRETLGAELATWREAKEGLGLANLRGFVLETAGSGAGGTGVENDWEAIATLQREGAFEGVAPVIAAGGLRAENVGNVVRLLQPYAVDVSSGVEEVFGEKSTARIKRFVEEVERADGQG